MDERVIDVQCQISKFSVNIMTRTKYKLHSRRWCPPLEDQHDNLKFYSSSSLNNSPRVDMSLPPDTLSQPGPSSLLLFFLLLRRRSKYPVYSFCLNLTRPGLALRIYRTRPGLALRIYRTRREAREPLRIGECPSNSPFLKNNGAEAHCF